MGRKMCSLVKVRLKDRQRVYIVRGLLDGYKLYQKSSVMLHTLAV